MNTGVYEITLGSEKKYIGSSVDIVTRKRKHIHLLRNGVHPNTHMQNAFNKYGGEFLFMVLVYCSPKDCLLYEQMAIDAFMPGKLYNIRKQATSNLGLPVWNKGKTGLQVAWNKGKKTPEDVRRKQSEAHKGNKWTSEQRKKMLVIVNNRSQETKDKLSKATTNYWKIRKGVNYVG